MKIIYNILIILFILIPNLVFAQTKTLLVNAPNGLACRVNPSTEAELLGYLSHGAKVALLERTQHKLTVLDDEKELSGAWAYIQHQNYPFVLNENESYDSKCYVFDGFLEPFFQGKVKVTHQTISKNEFSDLYKKHALNGKKLRRVKDNSELERLLEGKIKNIDSNVWNINLDNGNQFKIHTSFGECGTSSYFPELNVVILECGHSSEYSINLSTGEGRETAGDPSYISEAPNQKLRLNGYYDGQGNTYFIQKLVEQRWLNMQLDLGDTHCTDGHICYNLMEGVCNDYMADLTWISNEEYIFKTSCYEEATEADAPSKEADKYYRTTFKSL